MIDNVVIAAEMRIKVERQSFQSDQGKIKAMQDRKNLPCSFNAGKCATPLGTYLWKAPKETCHLALTQEATGIEAKNDKGQVVFMSLDGSLVRLVKDEALSICDRVVYRTNYPDIYLLPEKERPITRKIRPDEVSLTTYINNRDDFLYNHLADKLEEEFQKVLLAQCRDQVKVSRMSYWLQHAEPEVTTFFAGNGTFAATAGEVLYTYKCLEVHVEAVEMEKKCYRSLPVRAKKGATLPIHGLHSEIGANDTLFMEPLTRKLTPVGVEVPCTKTFAAKFKNTAGHWIGVFPAFHIVPAPREDIEEWNEEIGKVSDRPDFAQGGIYQEQEMRARESYLIDRDYQDAWTRYFREQFRDMPGIGRPGGGRTGIVPSDLFSNIPGYSWLNGAWGWLTEILHWVGQAASIFVALVLGWKFCTALFRWFYAFVIFRDLGESSCSSMLCWVPCSTTFLLREFRRGQQNQPGPGNPIHSDEADLHSVQSEISKLKEQLAQVIGPNSSGQKAAVMVPVNSHAHGLEDILTSEPPNYPSLNITDGSVQFINERRNSQTRGRAPAPPVSRVRRSVSQDTVHTNSTHL